MSWNSSVLVSQTYSATKNAYHGLDLHPKSETPSAADKALQHNKYPANSQGASLWLHDSWHLIFEEEAGGRADVGNNIEIPLSFQAKYLNL